MGITKRRNCFGRCQTQTNKNIVFNMIVNGEKYHNEPDAEHFLSNFLTEKTNKKTIINMPDIYQWTLAPMAKKHRQIEEEEKTLNNKMKNNRPDPSVVGCLIPLSFSLFIRLFSMLVTAK